MTRLRFGLIVVISTAFLAGAQAVPAAAQDTAAAGATPDTSTAGATPDTSAAGTTGAQQSSTCSDPNMTGLPKRPKFTNATIHYTLTGMTVGETYLIKAGQGEVGSGAVAAGSTVKGSFLLPDQGPKSKKIVISAIVYSETCQNAPWKIEKRINFKAVAIPAAATPGAPAPGSLAAPVVPPKPVPIPPIKPLKLPKPITQQLPPQGPPPSRRTWLTPIDGGARLDQRLSAPVLSRLERPTDKAKSGNALVGLGIFAGLFAAACIGGFMAFRRRDEVQFERAMTDQLKHLEEGDPGMEFAEDPDRPMPPGEQAPFALPPALPVPPEPVHEEAVTEPIAVPVPANGVPDVHRAEVESELQRILNEAGLDAELAGILGDARQEAERHGVALDADLMLQTLCEEINGSAKLSDRKRAELRSMFADIIAEEAGQIPAAGETVPTS